MQGKISMDLSFCQSDTGFSLDELVTKLEDVYERKAFAELLKMILQMIQEILIHRLLRGRLDSLKCCDRGHTYHRRTGVIYDMVSKFIICNQAEQMCAKYRTRPPLALFVLRRRWRIVTRCPFCGCRNSQWSSPAAWRFLLQTRHCAGCRRKLVRTGMPPAR